MTGRTNGSVSGDKSVFAPAFHANQGFFDEKRPFVLPVFLFFSRSVPEKNTRQTKSGRITAIPIGNFGKGRPLKKRAGVA